MTQAKPSAWRPPSGIAEWIKRPGVGSAAPASLFLLIGFAGPLLMILGYSFMPARTFSLLQMPTLENFASVVTGSYYISFFWSLLLASITVAILLLVCYPIAYGMTKLFPRWAMLITALVALPLLISENIRLFGWVLILLKNGILDGTLQYLFEIELAGFLYTVPAIVLGLVYVYLPFMLFPLVIGLSLVPDTFKEAAADLGADRMQIFREIELPLCMPGILIGTILTFVLALGALAEAKILGGQVITTIADDIESAFTFAQNWPRGAVLSVLLILLAGSVVFFLFRRVDLDGIIGRR